MKYPRVSGHHADPRSSSRWTRKWIVLLVCCTLAAAAIGFTVRQVYFHRSRVTDGLEALAVAFRDRRPFEARLSGVAYAPHISQRGPRTNDDQLSADLAERLLLEAVREE